MARRPHPLLAIAAILIAAVAAAAVLALGHFGVLSRLPACHGPTALKRLKAAQVSAFAVGSARTVVQVDAWKSALYSRGSELLVLDRPPDGLCASHPETWVSG